MAKSVKKVMKEEFDRLKNVLERLIKPKKEKNYPSLILQPVRNKTR
jgi:hypothetical protein